MIRESDLAMLREDADRGEGRVMVALADGSMRRRRVYGTRTSRPYICVGSERTRLAIVAVHRHIDAVDLRVWQVEHHCG